jgi:hypothetical protein
MLSQLQQKKITSQIRKITISKKKNYKYLDFISLQLKKKLIQKIK